MYYRAYWGDYGTFRGWHGGHRARRGDMGPIILRLLLEKPMHGYEIISRLEEKSHGTWRPSAGAVYPNLQMLEEQDLVASKEEDGKKVYSLTDKGKEAAGKAEETSKNHWQEKEKYIRNFKELRIAMAETIGALKDVAGQDSEEKTAKAKEILNDARDKLKKLTEEQDK